MKKRLEIIKPQRITLADQLKTIQIGQEVEIHIDQYKMSAIRQAAHRLKKEGIVLKVSEKGCRYTTKVTRIS